MSMSTSKKNQIRNTLQSGALMTPKFHKDGFITAQRKFKALSGRTSDMYARRIEELIPGAVVSHHKIDEKKLSVEVKFKLRSDNDGLE